MIKRVIVSTLLVGCVALAAAQGDSSAAAAANKSKGADALDAMLSTSKASEPAAKNSDLKNSTASGSSPAPPPSSSNSSSSSPSSSPAPAAPKSSAGGSSASGCSTPLQWLQNSGNYKKLLQLIDATPASARLADILDSPDVALTFLAPTDDAITTSLAKQGLSYSDLVANPALSLMVMQFHMLPNPIPTDQFVNGYSFNTLLPGDNFQDSVSVSKGGSDKIKLKGPHNAATLLDNGSPACISTVYSTDALLLPKRAIAGGASASSPAAPKAGAGAGADMPAAGADAPAGAAEPAAPATAAQPSHPPPEGARRAAAKGDTGGAPADPNAPVLVDAPASG